MGHGNGTSPYQSLGCCLIYCIEEVYYGSGVYLRRFLNLITILKNSQVCSKNIMSSRMANHHDKV